MKRPKFERDIIYYVQYGLLGIDHPWDFLGIYLGRVPCQGVSAYNFKILANHVEIAEDTRQFWYKEIQAYKPVESSELPLYLWIPNKSTLFTDLLKKGAS